MTDRDEYLSQRTYKGGKLNLHERMLYADFNERKAFAWLVYHLHTKGILSVDDVDSMLFDARPTGA